MTLICTSLVYTSLVYSSLVYTSLLHTSLLHTSLLHASLPSLSQVRVAEVSAYLPGIVPVLSQINLQVDYYYVQVCAGMCRYVQVCAGSCAGSCNHCMDSIRVQYGQ